MLLTPLQSSIAPNPEGVAHGFFERTGGVSTGIYEGLNCGPGSNDNPEHVRENRRRAAEELGASPSNLISLYQIHSTEVVIVTEPWKRESAPQADGMVTATPGIALGILTADCGPVLMWDEEACVVAAAHAGWKGALAGVIEATISSMIDHGARRDGIKATLGPTISQRAYEVGPEFVARFVEVDPQFNEYFAPSDRPGHAQFDLPSFILAGLRQSGISEPIWTGHCTYSDVNRFSYRRSTHRGEIDYGRNLSAIMLRFDP